MALSLTQTALVRITASQAITNNLLRLLALSPSVSISGSVATADLAAGAVTAAKTTPGAYFYGALSGTNAYTLSLSPALAAYADGVEVLGKVGNANTAAATATLNVDTLGAKNIYHGATGELLKAGDLPANALVHFVYNSTRNASAGGWDVREVIPSTMIRPATNVTTGTANAQAVVNTPVLTAYAAGIMLLVKVGSGLTNTGALTLACDGLAVRNVRRQDGSVLLSQDWMEDQTYLLYDDGTQFIVIGKWPDAAVCTVAATRNLLAYNNVATPDSKVDITADEVILKTSDGKPLLVSGVAVTLDISAGTALNGRETGASETASTWYYIWLISDGTTVAGVLEESTSGDGALPAGPDLSDAAFSGYVYKALVGAVRNDGSSNFKRFWQRDRDVFSQVDNIFTAFALATSWTALSSTELTNVRAALPPFARIARGQLGRSSNTTLGMAVSATKDDGTADTTNLIGLCVATGESSASPVVTFNHNTNFAVPVRGGASRNLQLISSATTAVARLNITGYTF